MKLLVAAGLLTALVGCASTQKRASTGQYIDDTVITTKVKASILNEPGLKMFQINVKSNLGVVQLSGFVDSAKSVEKAGDVAAHIEGVKEVRNDLNVK
jgi:osmotically-inducible protein OsmY